MKSKHINLTQDLKCDHWIWPWPWSWPWIFKVKYGICFISAKNGPIALVIQDHDHDHLVTKVRCKYLSDSDRGDFRCQRAVNSSSCKILLDLYPMKTSCHYMITFCITGPSWGESTSQQGILLHKGPVMWSFSVSLYVEQSVWLTFNLPVIWDAITLIWQDCNLL